MSELAQINFPGVQGLPADPGIAIGSPISSAAGSALGSAAGSLGSGLLSGVGSSLLGGFGSGLLSGAFGLINSAQNYRRQKKLNKQVYKQNKKLAELAYRQNVDMWKMQTEYNTPENQIARLRSAGVNPALAFGSGNITGNAEAAPELAYSEWNPRTPQFDLASPISAAIDTAQATGSALLNAAKLRSENARTIKDLASAGFSDAQTERIWSLLEGDIIQQQLRNSELGQDIEHKKRLITLTDWNIKEKEKALSWFDTIQDMRVQLISAQVSLTKKQEEEVDAKIKNLNASSLKLGADTFSTLSQLGPLIRKINAETSLLYSQKRLTDEQRWQVLADIALFNEKKTKLTNEAAALAAKSSLTWKEWLYYAQAHGGELGKLLLSIGGTVSEGLQGTFDLLGSVNLPAGTPLSPLR